MTSEEMLWVSISMTLMIAAPMIVIMLFLHLKPPKKRNSLYGYKTKRSMQSEENWRYANESSAKFFLIGTVIFAILSILKSVLFQNYLFSSEGLFILDISITTLLFIIIPCILPIIYIESQLKKMESINSKE